MLRWERDHVMTRSEGIFVIGTACRETNAHVRGILNGTIRDEVSIGGYSVALGMDLEAAYRCLWLFRYRLSVYPSRAHVVLVAWALTSYQTEPRVRYILVQ
jgi:hypothetical protein